MSINYSRYSKRYIFFLTLLFLVLSLYISLNEVFAQPSPHYITEGLFTIPTIAACMPLTLPTADIKANAPGNPPSDGPINILPNTSATISWTSTGADYCTLDPSTILPPTQTPLVNLRMNEGTGNTALDSSGNGNSATFTSGVTWANGAIGKSLNFDGVDINGASVPDKPSLRLTGDFTISTSVYINPSDSHTTWVRVVGKGDSDVDNIRNYGLWYSSGNDVLFQIFGPGGVGAFNLSSAGSYGTLVGSPIVLTKGSWYHLAGVKQGSTMYLYVNGILRSTTPISATPGTSNAPFKIGGYGGSGADRHNGRIDEVRLYNSALSQSDIQNLTNLLLSNSGISTGNLSSSQTYTLMCTNMLGSHSDSVTVNVSTPNLSPIANATISTDGVTYSDLITVIQSVPTRVYLAASSAGNISTDPDGWSDVTDNGKCEWNADLNSGAPTFEAPQTVNGPASAVSCNKSNVQLDVYDGNPDGLLMFNDPAGVTYTYQVLRINDGTDNSNIDTVQVRVNAPLVPNLDITSLSVPNGNVGSAGNASVTFVNSGTASTNVGFEVGFHDGSPAVAISCSNEETGVATAVLGAGSSRTVSVPFTYPASGNYTAQIMVDSDCVISESDESDNTATAPYTSSPPPQPDLTVDPVTTLGTLQAGQDVNFRSRVRNVGTATAANSTGRFCIDNSNCLTSSAGQISTHTTGGSINAPGQTGQITSSDWVAIQGNHTAYFCADVNPSSVTEIDESVGSNCANTGTFNVIPPPFFDLSPNPSSTIATIKGSADVASSPITISVVPYFGFSANVTLTVSGLPAGVTHSFVDSPSPNGQLRSQDFAAGSTLTFNVPASTQEGIYNISIRGAGGSAPDNVISVSLNVKVLDPGFKEVMAPIWKKLSSLFGREVFGFDER